MITYADQEVEKAAPEDYSAQVRRARRKVRKQRDAQAAKLYPHLRTFVLTQADSVMGTATDRVPRTLTLVTPDLDNPSRDHLFVGPYPVLSENHHWDAAFEELNFATSDGTSVMRGNLRLTHSRLRAYGTIEVGDESFSVQYEVPPQRYRMKVAQDAAYLSGSQGVISWDTNSSRWKDADWSEGYQVGFTWGINGEEIIGDEKVYTFLATFDDIATGRKWVPEPYSYHGFLMQDSSLNYGLNAGVKTPTGVGAELFPYQLRVRLSEFAYDFAGGMVVSQPGYKGKVYGCIGDWAGAHIGGLYRLHRDGEIGVVAVHDRTFYAGLTPAAHTEFDGNRVRWSGLPEMAAAEAGLPTEGYFVFSHDGSKIVDGSVAGGGHRVHADRIVSLAGKLGSAELCSMLSHTLDAGAGAGHDLTELIRMSQFTTNAKGEYYDVVQQGSMDDFYTILQNYMDTDLRTKFFRASPPPLDPVLRGIAHTKGTKGTDPIPWYGSLSVPYTATAVGKFSDDDYAKNLNTIRAESWLSTTTSASDVMAAQGPLLYQRRYLQKHDSLEWFLLDQRNNADKYAPIIDAKAEEWLKQARDTNVGTPEQLEEMEKQIKALADAAKKHKQYWAFALYTYAMTPAYLNFLQALLLSGVDFDGSEFSQRVQRTVALLNVLDTNSFFSQQYAYTLQMFQLSSILPQMIDLGVDIEKFHYVVKLIIDKFIDTYLNSPDPGMREAAEQLRLHASEDTVTRMVAIMRTSAAVGYGLGTWAFLASTFETTCARVLSWVPTVVVRAGALACAGLLLSFFLTGSADYESLPPEKKAFVITSGANIVAVTLLPVVRRVVALAQVWNSNVGLAKNLKMFVSGKLMSEAQKTATSGLRGWLIQEAGPKVPASRLSFKQWWSARQATAETAQLLSKTPKGGLLRVFGKNVTMFMARTLAAGFAILGIVMSAIDLHNSGEPLERAVHAMFLIASCLELVAIMGGWMLAGSSLAVGGMLVTTIFSIVSVVGFVALLIGAVLLILLMTQPQQSPVEKFAKEQAGGLYMEYKVAIESFRLYMPISQPQRSGIAVFPLGNRAKALTIGSDGRVTQGTFDSTGHTAFYIDTDEQGRALIGAPIVNTAGKQVLQTLASNADGAVTSVNFDSTNPPLDPKLQWYAVPTGNGVYERAANGVDELKAAPFVLYNAYWADKMKSIRFLATDSAGGWTLTDNPMLATGLQLEMVPTKPAELSMSDVSWLTIAHDERTTPALHVPGSLPRKWSISPALPDGLEFNTEDGTLKMREGYNVPPAPKQTYTVKVSNDLDSVQTSFSLEVKPPQEELFFA
ncbi:hypothetical protein Rhe02_02810 [Rhizocola hellebori]|uniref:Uncharacterized protein n=1 Tax=Rhizocola hellebori TaxID=1392758 RepID=A0A8J3VC40_9ACTN|nr:hypothetical protein [Rhizocola hellebori]GIH02214.1 hypothetical protein Rhe02_02810 [Rhizocola hellebori]